MKKAVANTPDQQVVFRRVDAQRIADAVHAHERGRRPRNSSSLPRAAGAGGGGGGSIFVGTYTGAWPKNAVKTISIRSGESTQTVSVINLLNAIMPGGERLCYVIANQSEGTGADYALLNAEA